MPEASADQDTFDLAAINQNPECLNRLVDKHGRRVFRYILARIKDRQLSEDLAQDVFIRLCRQTYSGAASPKTWIFTITRNRVIDFFRTQSRRPVSQPLEEDADLSLSFDPALELGRREELKRVLDWLSQLPQEQAEVIRLRIIAGLSFAEAAEVLGCSVPTCKSRLRYGLTKLKTMAEQETRT